MFENVHFHIPLSPPLQSTLVDQHYVDVSKQRFSVKYRRVPSGTHLVSLTECSSGAGCASLPRRYTFLLTTGMLTRCWLATTNFRSTSH